MVMFLLYQMWVKMNMKHTVLKEKTNKQKNHNYRYSILKIEIQFQIIDYNELVNIQVWEHSR